MYIHHLSRCACRLNHVAILSTQWLISGFLTLCTNCLIWTLEVSANIMHIMYIWLNKPSSYLNFKISFSFLHNVSLFLHFIDTKWHVKKPIKEAQKSDYTASHCNPKDNLITGLFQIRRIFGALDQTKIIIASILINKILPTAGFL